MTKDEALSYLLTNLVVERDHLLTLDQFTLFTLTNLAQQACDKINNEQGIIAHEVIEAFAKEYLESK